MHSTVHPELVLYERLETRGAIPEAMKRRAAPPRAGFAGQLSRSLALTTRRPVASRNHHVDRQQGHSVDQGMPRLALARARESEELIMMNDGSSTRLACTAL